MEDAEGGEWLRWGPGDARWCRMQSSDAGWYRRRYVQPARRRMTPTDAGNNASVSDGASVLKGWNPSDWDDAWVLLINDVGIVKLVKWEGFSYLNKWIIFMRYWEDNGKREIKHSVEYRKNEIQVTTEKSSAWLPDTNNHRKAPFFP